MREASQKSIYQFDGVTFDPHTGDVTHRHGSKTRLRPQAAKVLALLLAHAGDLVDRTTIREAVWANTVVEFDQGMNACIREIRRALRDTATDPRYIETLPRRGYRFVQSVELPLPHSSSNGDSAVESTSEHPRRPWPRIGWKWISAVGATVAALLIWAAPLLTGGPTREAPRLLVIPFSNASTDPSGDTVAAVLSDRLIAHLARIDPDLLAVIARTSSMRYAASPDPLAVAAGELDVDLALEGSVARDGELSLDLRLIDPERESQIWAGRFVVDPSHLAIALDGIGRAVAQAIDPAILAAVEAPPGTVGEDLQARDTALRIEYLLAQHTMEATRRADSLLGAALDDGEGDSRLLLARAEVRRRLGDTDEAERLAQDALRSSESADGHRILASVAQRRMEWSLAETHVRRAIDLAPGDPTHLHVASFIAAYRGKHPDAVDRMRRAQALDPISADLVADAGYVYIWAGAWDEAERRCRAALALEPDNAAALRCLIDLGWLTGSPEIGDSAAGTFLALVGAAVPKGSTAFDEYWRRLAQPDTAPGCRAVWKVKGLLVLGREDDAVEALREVTSSAPRCLPSVAVDPFFDGLRSDPEVREGLTSAGLGWSTEDG